MKVRAEEGKTARQSSKHEEYGGVWHGLAQRSVMQAMEVKLRRLHKDITQEQVGPEDFGYLGH